MRRLLFLLLFTFFIHNLNAQSRFWVSATPANWSGDNWSSISGGAPDGGGPPTGVEDAEFDANGLGNCTVDVLASFNDLIVDGYTAIIDINGNSFTVNGEADLASGTISDTPGTSELTINSTDLAQFSGTILNAEVNCTADRIDLDGSTFNADFTGTKIGAFDENGNGGNVFNGNFVLNHHANGGRIRLGVNLADTYNGSVTINNRSRGQIEFADNSAGNSILGDLNLNLEDSSANIIIADGATSSLTVSGNVNIIQNHSANGNLYLGNNGDVTVNGNLSYINTSSADNSSFYVANSSNSSVQIDGTSTYVNNSTSINNSRLYIGNEGDLTINDQLEVTNNAVASNSYVYFNHGSNSDCTYNGDILLNCNNSSSQGFLFGNGGGEATLSATYTISEGGIGISESRLYLRGITQLGGTSQTIVLTNNARFDVYDCSFSGDIDISAPRLFYRETVFGGATTLSKTGSSTDDSYGGNRFEGDATFNHSGDDRWLTANNVADTFNANVIVVNNGSGTFYLADDGGQTSIVGNLSVTTSGNSGTTTFANATNGSLTVGGDVTVNNSSAGNITIYLGNNGDLTVNGDVEITNAGSAATSQVVFANQANSTVNLNSKLKIDHSGGVTNGRLYIANDGDISIGDSLIVENSSAANNSQVYIGESATSTVQLNGDVVISTNHANADGFFFGNNNAMVSMAIGENLSIGASGFASGELSLANFTMNAITLQNLLLTSNAFIDIDNSSFASAVNFSAPRIFIDNTTIEGEAVLAKTGASDDQSSGGNVFNNHLTINHSGSGELRFGNTDPDSINGNFTINISGSDYFQFARSSKDNYVLGNVEVNVSGTSGTPNFYMNGDTSSSITVDGTTIINNNATGSANTDHYLVNNGDAVFNNDITVNNSSVTSSNAQVWMSSSEFSEVTLNGNLNINNDGSAFELDVIIANNGDVAISGDIDIINDNTATNADVILANNSTSIINIGGNVSIFNEGAGDNRNIYVANNGSATINGDVGMENSSNATNSNIYLANQSSSSLQLNGNVVLESTDADVDNISFGENGGVTTLADLQTITVGGGGFIGGDLTFRNFTQVGNTAQSITTTGSGEIFHYDSNWGGNVIFSSPRVRLQGSTFNGTANITKSGISDDGSAGGNVFEDDVTFTHTGSNRFYLATALADTFNANVIHVNNSNGGDFEIANNSLNNYIAGNLTVTHSPLAGDSYFVLARGSSSSLQIDGATSITSSGTPSNSDLYLGFDGDVTFNDNIIYQSSITSGTSEAYIANGGNSSVIINGSFDGDNNGSATTERIYFGNAGDINISGSLTLQNLGSTTTSDCFIADDASSVVTVGGSLDADNNGSGSTSRLIFGNSGDVIFNNQVEISNNSAAANSEVRIANNSTSLVTFNGNIILENTDANGDGITFGENTGTSVIAAAQTITIGAGGFNAGDLEFRNFTRTGATATNLTCSGTARIYSYDSDWQGEVSFTAPQIITRGSNYASTAYFEKTGATDNQSVGGNTFTDDVTFVNSGSGYLLMGNGNADSFGANVILRNTGSDQLYFAYRGAGHSISGDLTVENLGSGGNTVIIVSDINDATLSVGGNVDITNNGANTNNDIRFGDAGDITISGDLNILCDGTATTSEVFIAYENTSAIDVAGSVNINTTGGGNTKRLRFPRAGDMTISGQLISTNTSSAATTDLQFAETTASSLVVNGTSSFTNSGTGGTSVYEIGDNGDIIFQDDVSATNTSGSTNSYIRFNHNSNSLNTFNGSIVLENTNALGDGIYFGGSNGSATLADGETISIGGGGFVAGELYLRNFTQTGGTAQNLTITGTSRFYPYNSTFNGELTVEAPRFYNRVSTFNNNVAFTKTGATNENSYGGNTYNGNLVFTINGNAYQGMANNLADDYNGDLTLVQNGAGYFRPAYNRDCTISGDLFYNLSTLTRFGDAAGSLIFDGTADQSINDLAASTVPYFEELVVNKASGELTLNTPIIIANDLTLTDGLMNTDLTNTLTFLDNTSVTSTSNESHVVGPVNKIGNDAFNFPVGNGIQYRPIGIARVTSGSAEFQASYIDSSANSLYSLNSKDIALDHISIEEYWILDRLATTAQADVILSWDTASGGVDNLPELRVARWDGAQWANEGNSATTGNTVSGTVTSAARVTDFSPFTLASTTSNNPLPVDLFSFEGECLDLNLKLLKWKTLSEINNDYFTVYASISGTHFKPIAKVNGNGNSYTTNDYSLQVEGEYQYFYLNQTDFDGTTKHYNTIQIDDCDGDVGFTMFPNPISGHQLHINAKGIQYEITIFSAQGKLVYQADFNTNHTVDYSVLSKGIYYVSVNDGKEINTKKLVVK